MYLLAQKVEAFNRNSIPEENETIFDDFEELPTTIHSMEEVLIYFRDKDTCPQNRGNWMIDIQYKGGLLIALKLPKEMTEKQVLRFAQPLIDLLKKHQKENNND